MYDQNESSFVVTICWCEIVKYLWKQESYYPWCQVANTHNQPGKLNVFPRHVRKQFFQCKSSQISLTVKHNVFACRSPLGSDFGFWIEPFYQERLVLQSHVFITDLGSSAIATILKNNLNSSFCEWVLKVTSQFKSSKHSSNCYIFLQKHTK